MNTTIFHHDQIDCSFYTFLEKSLELAINELDQYNLWNNHDLGLIIRLFFTWVIIVLYQDQIRKCIQPKSNFTKTLIEYR